MLETKLKYIVLNNDFNCIQQITVTHFTSLFFFLLLKLLEKKLFLGSCHLTNSLMSDRFSTNDIRLYCQGLHWLYHLNGRSFCVDTIYIFFIKSTKVFGPWTTIISFIIKSGVSHLKTLSLEEYFRRNISYLSLLILIRNTSKSLKFLFDSVLIWMNLFWRIAKWA